MAKRIRPPRCCHDAHGCPAPRAPWPIGHAHAGAAMTLTVAGIPDITQRLNSDGLAALGLAGPLLCPAWTDVVPAMDTTALTFTVPGLWYAPCAGMLMQVADGHKLGLSKLDGTPAVASSAQCV